MSEEKEERRTNLKEYYEEVHICKYCKKPYGSDRKKERSGCPVCRRTLFGDTKWDG